MKILMRLASPVLLFICLAGCTSFELPPELSATEKERIAATGTLPLALGVDRYEHKVYSDQLISHLRRTRLFREVGYVDNLKSKPQFVAAVETQIYDDDLNPFVGILFGYGIVIPMRDEHFEAGDCFSLRRASSPDRKAAVHAVFRNRAVEYGIWLPWALHKNRSPDWSFREPEHSKRYTQQLRLKLLDALRDLGEGL